MKDLGLQPEICEANEAYFGISERPLQVSHEARIPLGLGGRNTTACFHIMDGMVASSQASQLYQISSAGEPYCIVGLSPWRSRISTRRSTEKGQMVSPIMNFDDEFWLD